MRLSACSNKTKHCLKVGRVELKGFFRASQASHGASAGLYVLLNFAASCNDFLWSDVHYFLKTFTASGESSVSYSRAWRDRKTLMDTTHSAACQQCQHTDKSCRPRYSDKGVMTCERCSHIGGVMVNMPTTDIVAWTAAVRNGVEVVADTLDRQAQTFGALLDHQTQSIDALLGEVHGMRAAIDRLSASGASSSQVVASTVDADDDEDEDDEGEDMDRAVESDGAESGDDEDGDRVDIALAGTGADLGESAEEEENEEEEAEGSGPACTAEAETFTPPAPLGCIRMPRPTTRSWKGKEVEKMRWE